MNDQTCSVRYIGSNGRAVKTSSGTTNTGYVNFLNDVAAFYCDGLEIGDQVYWNATAIFNDKTYTGQGTWVKTVNR